jgi:hypothetical protein
MPFPWLYRFASDKIEILLVFPENESRQQKAAYSLADSIVFAHKTNSEKSRHFITENRAEGYRR